VVVVNETFARNVFGKENPIGHRISGWARSDSVPEWREIVGVAGDVRSFGQSVEMPPEIYMPMSQAPDGAWNAFQRSMTVVARARPGAVVSSAMRGAVKSIDPQLPVYDVQTMETVLSQSTGTQRFNTMLLTLLGLTGLVLAAVGIYGVIAYAASQRTGEVATRMALGASPSNIFWLIVGQGRALALTGAIIGLAAAYASGRIASSWLFQVRAFDPLILAVSLGIVLAIAGVATVIPARRAARVEPVVAMRAE
jgi:putative ABC transport system permease protein